MLGRRVICPIGQANQHIILQIVGFQESGEHKLPTWLRSSKIWEDHGIPSTPGSDSSALGVLRNFLSSLIKCQKDNKLFQPRTFTLGTNVLLYDSLPVQIDSDFFIQSQNSSIFRQLKFQSFVLIGWNISTQKTKGFFALADCRTKVPYVRKVEVIGLSPNRRSTVLDTVSVV